MWAGLLMWQTVYQMAYDIIRHKTETDKLINAALVKSTVVVRKHGNILS